MVGGSGPTIGGVVTTIGEMINDATIDGVGTVGGTSVTEQSLWRSGRARWTQTQVKLV